MSASEQQAQTAAGAAAAQTTAGVALDDLINATKMTERPVAKDLIGALVEEALKGTVVFDKNDAQTIKAGMKAIDEALSKQLAAIMHHADFQKMEGSWRGLHHLIMNSETSTML